MSPTTTRALLAVALAGATACAEAPDTLAPIDHGPPEAARAEAQVEDAELADALEGVALGELLAEIMRSGGQQRPRAGQPVLHDRWRWHVAAAGNAPAKSRRGSSSARAK